MTWEAFAIRYGRHERTAQSNHLLPLPDPHEAMPLDYFVWLLRGPERHGFAAVMAPEELAGCRAWPSGWRPTPCP